MIYTPEYFALHGLGPNAPSPSYEHWRDHLLDSQDRDRVVREVQVALAGGRPYDTEYRVVWPDGAMHWLAARGQILRDPEGQPIRMLGVCFDVTRRRDAEEQLRQLDRLESVGRLAGGVAHEANNQMAVVLGAAAFVLRRSDLHEETRRDLMDIRHAAERTAAITKQLLAFSRRQVLSPQVLDLNALVQSFEAVLRRTLGEDIVLHVSARAERPQVYADEGQLHQMLLNLIVNARDAMEEGGELTIETGNVALDESAGAAHGVAVRAGPYVALWVRDNGCGMDPQTLAHAFEPFFTTKGVGRGTGLGLASVYGIVHQSDGYVFAESQPSKGTTFSILLPLSGDPIKASGMPPETSPEAVGKTALVIEDEPIVRAMLARTLRQAGFEVWDAADGHAALELVRSLEHPLDVVVTDLAIPGIRGRELADALTKLRPGLPLLFVSGYPGEEMVRQGLLETGCPFLQKPFEPEMVVRKVHELLGQSVPQSEP
jgi:signal transduction histidine kinase/CheY-like chemotaxis protein